ncbi:MAG: hypothetical protein ACK559_39070, partial [bacterium]
MRRPVGFVCRSDQAPRNREHRPIACTCVKVRLGDLVDDVPQTFQDVRRLAVEGQRIKHLTELLQRRDRNAVTVCGKPFTLREPAESSRVQVDGVQQKARVRGHPYAQGGSRAPVDGHAPAQKMSKLYNMLILLDHKPSCARCDGRCVAAVDLFPCGSAPFRVTDVVGR